MIGVHGATGGYRVAVAGLPLSVRSADDVRGAIVIVAGTRGWPKSAIAALEAGAAALVIAGPDAADDGELSALEAAAQGAPIVLDRPKLRADVAADAAFAGTTSAGTVVSATPRFVTADVAAVASELTSAVRDASGWLRMLAGGPLVVRAGERSPHGLLAVLEEPASRLAASVTASVLAGREGARVRVHAVGETRVEVDIDAAVDLVEVAVSTADGTVRRPRLHESHERLALRRAVLAWEGGAPVDDLEGFRHDALLADVLLGLPDKRG